MKIILPFIFIWFTLFSLQAQTVADFENFDLTAGTFLDGSDQSGGFRSGNVFLPNQFTPTDFGGFWSGWVISNQTDTLTPGFMNQYSAITGGGYNGSETYAITFASSPQALILENEAKGAPVRELYVTNTTYAYFSMLEGDDFAKRFGGIDGNDPDFLLLTIKGFLNGEVSDSLDVYLADYRFEDNSEDYILKEWQQVDVSVLGAVDSLQFSLSSSDVGDFGINTPAYVAVDYVVTGTVSATHSALAELPLNVFPNPATDYLQFDCLGENGIVQVFDLQGRLLLAQNLELGTNQLFVNGLANGSYVLKIQTAHHFWRSTFLKN